MFGLLGASVEVVRVRVSRYGAHNRTGAMLDRETGPGRLDPAVDSGSRHVPRRASLLLFKGRTK
jgi:hypothetical protein